MFDYTGKHQIVFLTGFNFLSCFWVTESETVFRFCLSVRFPKLQDFQYFNVKHAFSIKNIHVATMKQKLVDIFGETML